MRHALAITMLAGLFLLAAAYLIGGRYETVVTPQGFVVRTDRLTGHAFGCLGQRCVALPDRPSDFSDRATAP